MGLQVRPTAKSLVVHFQVPEIRNIQLPWDVKMTQQDGEETHRWVRKIQIRPRRISFWLSEEWNSNLICRLVGRLFSLTAVWPSVFLFRLLCWNKKVSRDLNCIFLLTKKSFVLFPFHNNNNNNDNRTSCETFCGRRRKSTTYPRISSSSTRTRWWVAEVS